jgi:hypothetical protein
MRWWWKQLAAVCVSRMLCVESRVSEGNTPALRSESRRMERWNSWAPEPPRRWKKDTHRAVQAKQERGIGGKEACLAPVPWPFITRCVPCTFFLNSILVGDAARRWNLR